MRAVVLAFIILAGVHAARAQYWGPPPGYYGGPPPWMRQGPGWYGPRSMSPYAGGGMHPDDMRSIRRWDWEMRRPRPYYPPPMGW